MAADSREQHLLRLAYRAADIGALVWTVATDRLDVDESAERLFGIRRGTFGASLRDLIRRVREESRDALQTALETVLGGGSLLEVEVVVDLPDGTARHLQLRGTTLNDPGGQPEHVVAAIRDVSREAALRAELVSSKHELAGRDDELRRLSSSMASAARVNANLLARTSHDIRTRLDAVLGMSRLLLDGSLSDEQRELVSTIRTQGDGMIAIVDDIIDMSTTTADLDTSPITIAQLVEDVAGGAAIDIAADVPAVVRADAARLRRILQNLVAATRAPARIAVHASPLGGELFDLAFGVHGIAVHADKIQQLFDGSLQSGGFGLAIAAKLVALLGGRIESAASTDDRLVVRFTVPVERSDGDGVADVVVDPELGAKHPLRVLVAEDNLLNRKVAGAFLTKLGYAPRFASNGREALDAIEREPLDVVFMDVDMPIMDGLEAARELRRRRPREHAPRLVAVTANALPRDRAACIEAGYDDYLSKPLRIEQLAAQLAKCKRVSAIVIDPATVDVAVLGNLEETLGAEIVTELVETYDSDARELMAALEAAAHRGDATALARAAHTLKSISAALGAVTLNAICAQLEISGREGVVERATPLVERAGRELVHVRDALTAHVLRVRG